MPRTNASHVKQIIDTSLTEDQVGPFLRAANTIVTAHLTGSGLPGAQLAEIEAWLTAHLVSLRDRQAIKEAGDGVSVTYEGAATGDGLKGTRYGQQVLLLDSSGVLAALSDPDRISYVYRVGSE